tara:strand:- start:4271 stop:5128 length:858 start_codon:yes stop_codon:yes gene_type:complete
MSYNGSGTFVINSTGQPVVTGTVISSSTFNSLTADLGTGLSTAITKDGQTTTTAKIPFAQGLSAAVASNFAAGTVGAPSIYLSTDTTTGLYRIGANNDGFAISGTKLLDFGSALLGVTGALTVSTTLGVTGTITPGQTTGIVGTTTNNSAQAGSVGEYIESRVVQGSAVSLTTATSANVTSISLTAGDWNVSGMVAFDGGATTILQAATGGASSTSATLSGSLDYSSLCFGSGGVVANLIQNTRIAIPTLRFSLSGTTTIYLVANAIFTTSTEVAYGQISARRVR